MSEFLQLEVISPEKLQVSRPVSMVVLPASEGLIGALPGHSPLGTSLTAGTVDIYDGEQIEERFFVSGGFVEITDDRCTVLAEEVLPLADINRENVLKEIEDLEQKLSQSDEDDDKQFLESKLSIARAKRDAVTKSVTH